MWLIQEIFDSGLSNIYVKETKQHFKRRFNIELQSFRAVTPKDIKKINGPKDGWFYKYNELNFRRTKVRTNNRPQGGEFTLTEIACFCTHFEMWKRCIKLKKPIAIIEHDARLDKKHEDFDIRKAWARFHIPNDPMFTRNRGFASLGRPPMTIYFIHPTFAYDLVGEVQQSLFTPINHQVDAYLITYCNKLFKKGMHRIRVFIQSKEHGKVINHGGNTILDPDREKPFQIAD